MVLYKKILEEFEKGFIGYATLAIIGQSCLGSIAAMYVLKNGTSFFQMFQLTLVVFACMFLNGAVLAQQRPKLVLNMLIISVLTSILLIFLNLFYL
ncbi:MAG: hypothetical protein QM535_11920 [Limnohabitans sp.]|nr:hypothetical protein [Limnohabitans sp.]